MKVWRNIKDIMLAYYLPKNDFVLVSFPKVGRTWLKFMMNKIYAELNESVNSTSINLSDQAGELAVLKDTHDWSEIIIENGYRPDPELLFKYDKRYLYHRSKVVFMVRDPRDTIVSHYHQVTKRATNPFQFNSISDFIKDPLYGFNRIIRFYNIWANNSKVPKDFLLLRYEDLMEQGEQELRKLIDFMGIKGVSDELIKRVYEESSANKMRKLEQKAQIDGFNSFGSEANTLKVRKAKVGAYASELTAEDIHYCNEQMKALSPKYKYTT